MLLFTLLVLLVIFTTRTILFFEEAENQRLSKTERDALTTKAIFSLMMTIATIACLIGGCYVIPTWHFALQWRTVGIVYSGLISLFWIAVLTIRWTKTSLIIGE